MPRPLRWSEGALGLVAVTALAACSANSPTGGPVSSAAGQVASTSDAPTSNIPTSASTPSQPSTSGAASQFTGPTPSVTGQATVPPPISRTPPAATGASTAAAGPARCHTSQLAAAQGDGQRQTGTVVSTWSLTNVGGRTCTVDGYVGMGLEDDQGHQYPTKVVRGAIAGNDAEPSRLVLGPRQAAHWTVSYHGNGGASCPPASSVLVTPPDELDSLTVKQPLTVCDYTLFVSALYL